MTTDFGKRVRAARKHAQLNQAQLAKLAGFDGQSAISEMENRGYGSARAVKIAEACGVSPTWLTTGEGVMLPGAAPFVTSAESAPSVASYNPEQQAIHPEEPIETSEIPVAAAFTRINISTLLRVFARWYHSMGAASQRTTRDMIIRIMEEPADSELLADQLSRAVTGPGVLTQSPALNRALANSGGVIYETRPATLREMERTR